MKLTAHTRMHARNWNSAPPHAKVAAAEPTNDLKARLGDHRAACNKTTAYYCRAGRLITTTTTATIRSISSSLLFFWLAWQNYKLP